MATQKPEQSTSWKSRTYLMGALIGGVFGFISAYLYTRAAEENTDKSDGKPESIPTGQLLAVVLAALGLARQISEMGKPPRKK